MKNPLALMLTMLGATLTLTLTLSTTAFAQIGSLDKDLVYTPVAPCRLFDTRTSQGGSGPVASSGTKSFYIWGQSTYAAQGGAASNCGLQDASSNIAAVAMNLTVVTPSAGGFITAYLQTTQLPKSTPQAALLDLQPCLQLA